MTLATCLLLFINSHDDGTPQPRARMSDDHSCIVVRSTEILASGGHVIVENYVSSIHEARDLLGY